MKSLNQENNKWRQALSNKYRESNVLGKYHTNKDNQYSYYVLTAYSYAYI